MRQLALALTCAAALAAGVAAQTAGRSPPPATARDAESAEVAARIEQLQRELERAQARLRELALALRAGPRPAGAFEAPPSPLQQAARVQAAPVCPPHATCLEIRCAAAPLVPDIGGLR